MAASGTAFGFVRGGSRKGWEPEGAGAGRGEPSDTGVCDKKHSSGEEDPWEDKP